MREPLLSCRNLQKTYSLDLKDTSELRVLRGIDFEVFQGEVVTIVGASGSGKSTFLHLLGGLDRPTAGNVLWKGIDIATFNDETLSRERSRHVGFVFQFHHLLPEFTALENVMIPLMIAGAAKRKASEEAEELLRKVDLTQRMHHKPTELSGGEQQRIAVARALANHPAVLLADEPTGNLDSANSEQLEGLLQELNREEGQTFVIVTHNEKFMEHSNRTYRMVDGHLVRGHRVADHPMGG